jgi:hypothetical protein
MKLLHRVLKDLSTGVDGETYDPGRVVGYSLCILGVVGFIFCETWTAMHGTAFSAEGFGIGFGALMTSFLSVAGGLKLKESMEPVEQKEK